MKKLIIFVLTLFLTFTIFLSGKSANAELTPIAPVYSGDIFNGQELYLFQNYSATPNFENGYISKQTITNQDIYYQENSYYNGWYKNLGEDLIYEYTEPDHEPEHPIFYFYITLNGLLSQYFQFALICPEPFEAEYTIKFRNENPFVFLTANQYNNYLVTPPTNDMTKEIEWFCFEVYFPDYMASFKPLTAQLAYDFGFSSGERNGYNSGYNTGYSTGYNNGYDDGYDDGTIDIQYGFNTVVNFNQLVQNGNFENTDYWDTIRCSINSEDGYGAIISGLSQENTNFRIYQNLTNTISGHKILIKITTRSQNLNSLGIQGTNLGGGYTFEINENWNTYGVIFQCNIADNFQLWINTTLLTDVQTVYSFEVKNVMLFDLTEIYGIGYEPQTIDDFNIDFPSQYYDYTRSTIYSIDYENGYIKGQKDGYQTGYENGKDAQATQQLTSTGWISSIFGGISSLLNIQIFPGVTIGIIVGIPFVISLAYFVIRAFRGGGGA